MGSRAIGPETATCSAPQEHGTAADARRPSGAEAYGATKAAQINLLEALRVHLARTGVQVTTVCPGCVRTDLTAGNRFPMPFLIDAGQAARSICDGLERDRTEIVFPAPMALLMKAAPRPPPAPGRLCGKAPRCLTPVRPNTPTETTRSKGHHETAQDRRRRKTPGRGFRLPLRLHHDH